MKVTREEVEEKLVSDLYFEEGHYVFKIRQFLLTLVAWIIVAIPFLWLAIPVVFPNLAYQLDFQVYFEEVLTFEYLILFLGTSFLFFVLLFVVLTFRNNRRFKKLLQKKLVHDEETLVKRKEILEVFYEERFGSKEKRHGVRYYEVSSDKNIGESEIQDLFRRNEVS